MYVFYPDVFFFHNMILIGIISVFSFQLMKIPIKENLKEIVVGSLLGSMLETILLLLSGNYFTFTIFSQACIVPVILWIQLRKHHTVSKRQLVIVSYSIVFLFIGVTNVMELLLDFDMTTQFGVLVIILIVEGILLELKKVMKLQKSLYQVMIANDGNQIMETALYDSGNCLRNPWKKRPVHIVSEQLLQKLKLIDPVLMVPYRSLGNEEGLLEVYEAEGLTVWSRDGEKRFTNVLLGRAEDSLLRNRRYQIILHESVFGKGAC